MEYTRTPVADYSNVTSAVEREPRNGKRICDGRALPPFIARKGLKERLAFVNDGALMLWKSMDCRGMAGYDDANFIRSFA